MKPEKVDGRKRGKKGRSAGANENATAPPPLPFFPLPPLCHFALSWPAMANLCPLPSRRRVASRFWISDNKPSGSHAEITPEASAFISRERERERERKRERERDAPNYSRY
jgi:hypothetical protein